MPDLDAVILAAAVSGRRQKLTRDKLFSYILAEVRKTRPDIRWRSLRRHVAAMKARRALTSLSEEPEHLVDIDDMPLSWKNISNRERLETRATPQGLLIPWALVNKLKTDFRSGR